MNSASAVQCRKLGGSASGMSCQPQPSCVCCSFGAHCMPLGPGSTWTAACTAMAQQPLRCIADWWVCDAWPRPAGEHATQHLVLQNAQKKRITAGVPQCLCIVFAEENGLQDIRTADWSNEVAPFWGEVVKSAMTSEGIWGLLKAGWTTIKGG